MSDKVPPLSPARRTSGPSRNCRAALTGSYLLYLIGVAPAVAATHGRGLSSSWRLAPSIWKFNWKRRKLPPAARWRGQRRQPIAATVRRHHRCHQDRLGPDGVQPRRCHHRSQRHLDRAGKPAATGSAGEVGSRVKEEHRNSGGRGSAEPGFESRQEPRPPMTRLVLHHQWAGVDRRI